MDDFDFSIQSQAPDQRSAFRAMVRGIQARITSTHALYEVYDVSVNGCSIVAPLHDFTVGTLLEITLEIKSHALLPDLKVKVARHIPSGLVAFSFLELTRPQEYILDKIILELQKRQIAQSKGSFRQQASS